MLDTFRENARSWLIQVLIAAIAIVFIFSFGPSSPGCGASTATPTWAAKVNGETVPASTFNTQLNQRLQFARMRRGGGTYTRDDARADRLREETMKDVVDRELAAQAALRHGLYVSNDDVADEILDTPDFQRAGQFDEKTYRQVLAASGLTPAVFEERVRRDLLTQRMIQFVRDAATVSEDEIRAQFLKQNEAASIEYVRFTPSQFRDQVQVTDADIDRVLSERRADVEQKFEATRFLYVQPRGIKARRLFVPVAQDATPEQEQAARQRIEQAQAALQSGESFESLAAGLPDPSAREGGDIGWVELGRSPFGKTFEEATFRLKAGETSDIVRDRFGFHIVRAVEERPAEEKQLADVQRDLARDLAAEEKAAQLAREAAASTLQKLKQGVELATQWPAAQAAEGQPVDVGAQKPQVAVTDEFRPFGGYVPGIGAAPKLSAAAFALSADKRVPDEVVEDQNAFFVFELETRKRADLSGLDAQKEPIREMLLGQKQAELQSAWLDEVRKEAKVVENADLLSYEVVTRGVVDPGAF